MRDILDSNFALVRSVYPVRNCQVEVSVYHWNVQTLMELYRCLTTHNDTCIHEQKRCRTPTKISVCHLKVVVVALEEPTNSMMPVFSKLLSFMWNSRESNVSLRFLTPFYANLSFKQLHVFVKL